MQVVVCSSGGGSNFESLVAKSSIFNSYKISRLVVDNNCAAIEIAHQLNIEVLSLPKTTSFENEMLDLVKGFDLVVLAGFMPIVPHSTIIGVNGQIINTHPSLLPKYGGKGMYGVKVQESVLASNEKIAGCTVHQVTAEIDRGRILAQSNLLIPPGIDAWSLGGLVHNLERELLPATVDRIARKEIILEI